MYQDLTPSEKFVFEWQYRMAGGFNTMLAHLFCKADAGNFARLAAAFPVEAEGMEGYLHENKWWERVQMKALDGHTFYPSEAAQLEEMRQHPHLRDVPPEWAQEFAERKAREAFGYYIAENHPDMIMPTEAITKAIDAVMSKFYPEWHN